MQYPIEISMAPLSVNDAWKGRRFRSDRYKSYTNALMFLLPKKVDLPNPPFEIRFWFGFSSLGSDWDNPVKPLQDILSKKYGFNDNTIKRGVVEVEKVAKQHEYIRFQIVSFDPKQ